MRRWALLGGLGLAQAAVIIGVIAAVDAGSPWPRDWLGRLSDVNLLASASLLIVVISALQAVFVLPVWRPAPAKTRGWPVRVSLAVAGLAVALLAVAAVFASRSALEVAGIGVPDEWGSEWTLLAVLLVGWSVATPLLIAFCRRGPRESLLARVAAWIFAGTVIEAAAIIPVDVMIRRRTQCYCAEGTYWALLICGGVGLFVLGPAALLPVLARRRRRWYAGRCEVCGYDMAGCAGAARCPECGTGWRISDQP